MTGLSSLCQLWMCPRAGTREGSRGKPGFSNQPGRLWVGDRHHPSTNIYPKNWVEASSIPHSIRGLRLSDIYCECPRDVLEKRLGNVSEPPKFYPRALGCFHKVK